MKNEIIDHNIYEEDDNHQQREDVPQKEHSNDKHDHEDDKNEDCQEHWVQYGYNEGYQQWGLRIENIEHVVSEDKIEVIILQFEISYVYLLHIAKCIMFI